MARTIITGEPRITPYDIVDDILTDPEYFKHFVRRFKAEFEKVDARGKQRPVRGWYISYKDNPELMLKDIIDEIKVILGRQESSASLYKLGLTMRNIAMKAAGDWIHEHEGTVPEYEIFPNTVHTLPIPFEKYYVTKEIPLPEDKR